jgi:hypothetical protein
MAGLVEGDIVSVPGQSREKNAAKKIPTFSRASASMFDTNSETVAVSGQSREKNAAKQVPKFNRASASIFDANSEIVAVSGQSREKNAAKQVPTFNRASASMFDANSETVAVSSASMFDADGISLRNSPTPAEVSSTDIKDLKSLLHQVLAGQNKLNNNLERMQMWIMQNGSSDDRAMEEEQMLKLLPVKSLADLQKVEDWLQERSNKKVMFNHLRTIGGVDLRETSTRLLQAVLHPSVVPNISRTGRKGGKVLSNLTLH